MPLTNRKFEHKVGGASHWHHAVSGLEKTVQTALWSLRIFVYTTTTFSVSINNWNRQWMSKNKGQDHFLLFADFPLFSFMQFKKLFSNSYSDGMAALKMAAKDLNNRCENWQSVKDLCEKYAASKLKIPWWLSYFFVCLQMAKRSSWSSILTLPCLFWRSVSPAWTQGPTGPWRFSNRERWKRRKQEGGKRLVWTESEERERGKRKKGTNTHN